MRSTALASLSGLALLCASALTCPPAMAARSQKAAPQQQGEAAKPDPAAAERAMEAGIKAYEAGKNDQAAQSLSSAMQGGALPGQKMARALYYRGLAYKKSGKPAQAISDLTSALWLKGGLSDTERTDALAQREAAYKEAGIGQAPAATTSAGRAAAKSAPATTVAAADAAKPAATEKPAEAPASSSGGFFSNLFGSGSTASAAPAAAGAPAAAPPPEPAASSWSSTTQSSTGAKPTTPAPAAAPAPPPPAKVATATPPAAAPPAAEGKFRLQVAAVRSREEANKVAQRLKKDFAKKLHNREPVIDEAVIGNMGTFYRVRVGPYASVNEPRQLCITLRASGGYDCLVITQ